MPTTKSAQKAFKVSQKKRSRNRRYLELFKESVKVLQKALASQSKDIKYIQQTLSEVYSRVDTLEKKNIIHKNNAARKKSTFARAVAAIQ